MYALSPAVIHVLQMAGLFPVGLEILPFRKLLAKTSIRRRLYTITLAVVNCVGFYSWLWQLVFIEAPEIASVWGNITTSTVVVLVICSTFSICLATLVSLMVAFFRVERKIILLEKLREVEFLLWSRECSHNTRLVSHMALANTFVAALYTIYKNILDYTPYDTLFVLFKVLILCGIVEWSELVLAIKDRFHLVNARVEELVARSCSKELLWSVSLPCVEGFSMPQELSLTIQDLSKVHWKLCYIVDDMNDIYGCQLVSTVFFLFLQLICHPHFFMLMIFDNRFSNDLLAMVVFLDWIVIYITALFLMMWSCSTAVAEAKKTVSVVTKLMGNKMRKSLFNQLERFAQQLFHRDVMFSACGLFTLRSSIIITMASAVSTYMAVIIQFQISAEEEDEEKEVVLPT